MTSSHGPRLSTPRPAPASHALMAERSVCTLTFIGVMPGDLFLPKWHRNPERPMSQSERL